MARVKSDPMQPRCFWCKSQIRIYGWPYYKVMLSVRKFVFSCGRCFYYKKAQDLNNWKVEELR